MRGGARGPVFTVEERLWNGGRNASDGCGFHLLDPPDNPTTQPRPLYGGKMRDGIESSHISHLRFWEFPPTKLYEGQNRQSWEGACENLGCFPKTSSLMHL